MTAFYLYDCLTHRVHSITWTVEQAVKVEQLYRHMKPWRIMCELSSDLETLKAVINHCAGIPAMVFVEGNQRFQQRGIAL